MSHLKLVVDNTKVVVTAPAQVPTQLDNTNTTYQPREFYLDRMKRKIQEQKINNESKNMIKYHILLITFGLGMCTGVILNILSGAN